MAVNLFTGSTDSNWGTSTNWSLGSVPTAADGNVATFDATSPACTVNALARVCNAIDFTGYTNTITMSQNITVSGAITLGFGVGGGASGSGILIVGTAGVTLTASGSTWNGTLRIAISGTYTLADDWTVVNLQPSNTTQNTTINGFKIFITGNLDMSNISNGSSTGTTVFEMSGTGSINLPSSTGSLKNDLIINTAGTITFPTGTLRYNTGTMTYTAGTVANTSNTDLVVAASTTFNTSGSAMTFKSITITAAATLTLSSDLNVGDFAVTTITTTSATVNGNNFNITGSMTMNSLTSGTVAGTTVFNLLGTGTVSMTSITTGRFLAPITINTAGTITFTSVCNVDIGKVLLSAGTVITDSGTWTTGGGSSESSSVFG